MKRYSNLALLLVLLLAVTVLAASCGKGSETSAETTRFDTTESTPLVSEGTTVTEKETTTVELTETTAPESTAEPATPGLTYESTGDGFCYVTGILDESATRIVIPEYNSSGDYVLGIKMAAFWMNTRIESVVINGSVDSIGTLAFYGCTSLSSVELGEGVLKLESGAFQACTSLTKIHIPSTINSISTTAFYGCTSLQTMTVSEESRFYRAESNCIIDKETNELYMGCVGSKIPKTVTKIGAYAFYYMGLREVLLPDNITAIGQQAFAGNDKLKTVSLSENLTEIGGMAFANCTSLETIYIPRSVTLIEARIFQNCNALTNMTIDEDNETYSSNGLCIVERATGKLVQGLRASSIPEGVTGIGDSAFYSMLISAVTLPEGVTEIGARAFANCNALSEITIPASVIYMANDAFEQCNLLSTVNFGGSEVEWYILTATVTLPEDLTVNFFS